MQAFLKWWLDQLSSLLPERVISAPAVLADAVLLELDDVAVRLLVRVRGITRCVAEAVAEDAGIQDLARTMATQSGLPQLFLFRLPAAVVLKKLMILPLVARGNLDEVLGFEIDRETPFARDEVYWTHSVRQSNPARDKIAVDLVLVPRLFVDPLVEAARRANLTPAGIEVDTGNNSTTCIRLGAPQRVQWLSGHQSLRPLAMAAAALAVLAIITPLILQQWAIASADSAIAALGQSAQEAAKLRQSVEQRSSALGFLNKERDGSPLVALSAVTRILPDDTYLNAFSLRDGKLTISGLSPSAAKLIGLLAHSPEFRDPEFAAPVVGNPDSDMESFTISVALKSKGAT